MSRNVGREGFSQRDHFPEGVLSQRDRFAADVTDQQKPSMRMNRGLTNYQLIWQTVRQIPRGRVATYGEVAEQAGVPGQARLVGYALHNLPSKSGVPWHRVINSQGKISLPRRNSSYQRQKSLLRREGVVFAEERVDLDRFGWLRVLRKRK